MADGSTKPIEDVKVGDKVRNAEPDDSSTEIHTVTALHITDTDRDFVDVTIATPAGPKKITSTAHHSWWDVTTHAWTDAADLAPGDLLDTPGGGHAVIQSLNRYTSSIRTYNLTIDTTHTCYVVAGATPVLVHNCNFRVGDADEHYDKHVLGLDDAGNPTRTPDMPEYDYDGGFEKYVADACKLMCGQLPKGAIEATRGDGVLSRLDPQGRLGMRSGNDITTFFRPDDPLKYFQQEAGR
ncbi:Hint domain-containing protein [Amycolatopsis sp. NPDC001319]|uniref:Hint domain-containing protein n=1 Tax=unclassified Amycolatopsis TaxID=2618356 RepID=UPI00367F4913